MARKLRPLPPPETSSVRIYVQIEAVQTRMFRYLIEARDNLAYTSVVDRKACILKLVCAPGQEQELSRALEDIGRTVPLQVLDIECLSVQ